MNPLTRTDSNGQVTLSLECPLECPAGRLKPASRKRCLFRHAARETRELQPLERVFGLAARNPDSATLTSMLIAKNKGTCQ